MIGVPTEQEPLEPKPAFYPTDKAADDMYFKVTCSPSLGQATTICRHQDSVRFSVLLETNAPSRVEEDEPQVCIWHNHGGHHDWAELSLKPTAEGKDVLLLNRPQDRSISRRWFTAELPGLPKHGQVMSFTVKFLVDTDHGWRWIKDTTGVDDGELHYQSADFAKHSSYDLKHWFSEISPDIQVQSERPDTEGTYLYSLTAPVGPAKDTESGWQHHQLGLPNHSSRWFSLVRLWVPWLAPRQGKGQLDLDKDGVLLSFLRTDGLHVVVLGISGIDDIITTFFNDRHGNVIIKGRNDRTEVGTARVLVAVAQTFEIANAAVFYHARKVVRSYDVSSTDDEVTKRWSEVKPEWLEVCKAIPHFHGFVTDNLEEWYDGLTYCTWNGLGQNLTSQKILDALDSLSKENIIVTNLIIDDNWQSLAKGDTQFVRGWLDFEANKDGFPDGMKATTSEIRKRHPNINHIGVWHALLGYWGGIEPNGWIAKNYKTIEVEKEAGVAGGTFTVVAAEDASRMYNDFYKFLSESGIDSVKTDAQCFLDLLQHAPDRRALTTVYQDAWTVAHLRHLSARAISCMSQSPQLIFHSQLPTDKPRLLLRNSDDFFPEVAASHPWHIFCNAHNSLLTQHLNALPDWDMFQTSHEWGSFHAAARAVSGGPIYFTDVPGQHDVKLIRQMTAQTPRGKTVILRPDMIGKAIDPYNSNKALAMLKIGTYVGYAETGSGILGIFNVSGQHLNEFIHLDDFPGTETGEYVVGSFTSGEVSPPISRGQPHAMVGLELETYGWDIVTAYALRTFTVREKKLQIANMGLLGKMTGSAAVTGCDMYVEDNGRLRIWTIVKALGVLGLWISDLPGRKVEDLMVMIFGNPIPAGTVGKNEVDGRVLEIDVERAWRESGEDAGWNNEVSLEIFVH
ncbi:glycoside hydrolase family 36 protein [Zasmidium cellare ATCC 36951]|uniref:Glycoside hydrolase family 36 protein n=1 Tax=Zasmidium cellare ATCC 36951 TaxID=1080233 RepID=A0A6A6D1X1_ZASCE|nr:glycoside hydrolase family 36 protein [Zasmidium cellare ATCC 36951]KAF2173165.1 glycoside hydrolase family 36 protein [Zasmidium cellare ATCC 36951]